MQRLRKVPKIYGLLSSILTALEDSKLRNIFGELSKVSGLHVRCLMYDGCAVEYDCEEARNYLARALPSVSRMIGVEVVEKPWSSPKFDILSLPVSLLFSGAAEYDGEPNRLLRNPLFDRACLFNAVRNLIGDDCPACPRDGPFCVDDFNATQGESPHGAPLRPYLLRACDEDDCGSGMYVAYQLVSGTGHFFAVVVTEAGQAILYDDAMGERAVTRSEVFARSLRMCGRHAPFRLSRDVEYSELKEEVYFAHGGSAPCVISGSVFQPPQERCLYCNCSLAKYRKREVPVLRYDGFRNVWDEQKRCVSKKRRSIYSSNYVKKSGESRRNTLLGGRETGGAIFLTAQSGICARLLATHYSRTLRAGVNPSSEAASVTHAASYFNDVEDCKFEERRVSDVLRAGMNYWMRLLDIESGVEGQGVIASTRAGYGFPIDSPLTSSPLYQGAQSDFVMYDICRDYPGAVGCVRTVISDGNMVNARDLEEDEVELRRSKVQKGRPRGATAPYGET